MSSDGWWVEGWVQMGPPGRSLWSGFSAGSTTALIPSGGTTTTSAAVGTPPLTRLRAGRTRVGRPCQFGCGFASGRAQKAALVDAEGVGGDGPGQDITRERWNDFKHRGYDPEPGPMPPPVPELELRPEQLMREQEKR